MWLADTSKQIIKACYIDTYMNIDCVDVIVAFLRRGHEEKSLLII